MKIGFQKWMLLPLLAFFCYFATEFLSVKPIFVEEYYSQTFYPFVAKVISNLSNSIPFSIDDIFYLLLILVPCVLVLLLLIRKISFSYAGKIVLNTLALVYILFYVLWGFNYYRPQLNERLGIASSPTNQQKFLTVMEELIDQTNKLHCTFEDSDKNTIDSLIEDSYKNLATVLKIQYPMGFRTDKQITFSHFYAQSGITGYFGPFFNEVHVNKKVLPLEYPFVLAHEKAHQLGITSEAEANFYAWLVCSRSNSQHVQYSANLTLLRHFLNQAYKMKAYPKLLEKIDVPVKNDFNTISKHWAELRNEKMDRAASKVNDAYLKTNKIKGGIKDYRGVVKHVMNFSLDSAFQKRNNLLQK